MTDEPDKTFVCLIMDGLQIKGMGIAYDRRDDVFLWQASGDLTAADVRDLLQTYMGEAR